MALKSVPIDDTITIDQLIDDPYPIYRRLRKEAPVLRVTSLNRVLLTKAEDTRAVKDDAALFSSDDPNTPMKRAFQAHTLMRKDGAAHRAERMAIMPAFHPRVMEQEWVPLYRQLVDDYLDRLPRHEVVDLFPALCGPLAARLLAHMMGMPDASDEDMQRWSQCLIDGAGNFGWRDDLFAASDTANEEMNRNLAANTDRLRAEPDSSALSAMVNAETPIAESQIISNIKIAIGGGINEPRDAALTILAGLLSQADQREAVLASQDWAGAFEEAVRWVAPIQVSSRIAMDDTEIRGYAIAKGETVMTSQASANRDEELVDNGEIYDATRPKNRHQAFGNGPHMCMGAQISRKTVGEILIPRMFERFPNMQIAGDVIWRGFAFRGPVTLPVMLGA